MDELLSRFFRDECTPEEQKEVVEYLQNPSNELLLRGQLWQQWNRLQPQPGADLKRIWVDVRRQTDLQPSPRRLWHQPTLRLQIARFLVRLCLTLALACAIYLLHNRSAAPELVYQTGPGQRLTFTLPDHSTVVLEENSSISYSTEEPFTDPAVRLVGAAVFQIAPQTGGRHFIIRTSDRLQLQTRQGQLRLSFRGNHTRALVRQGVALLNIQNGLFEESLRIDLNPGDLTLYDESSNRLVRRQEDVSSASKPARGKP